MSAAPAITRGMVTPTLAILVPLADLIAEMPPAKRPKIWTLRRRLKRLAARHPEQGWLVKGEGEHGQYLVNRSRLQLFHPQIFEAKQPSMSEVTEIGEKLRETRKDLNALRKAFRATSHAQLTRATANDSG